MEDRTIIALDDRATRAREARHARHQERRAASILGVFVIRAPPPAHGFRWEIRRFGTIVLRAGADAYATPAAAQAAGETVRARWPD